VLEVNHLGHTLTMATNLDDNARGHYPEVFGYGQKGCLIFSPPWILLPSHSFSAFCPVCMVTNLQITELPGSLF